MLDIIQVRWNFCQKSVESPIVAKVNDDKGQEGRRRENRFL